MEFESQIFILMTGSDCNSQSFDHILDKAQILNLLEQAGELEENLFRMDAFRENLNDVIYLILVYVWHCLELLNQLADYVL